MAKPLPRKFYLAPTERVARALLGKVLCVRTAKGIERSRIVETEAYLGETDRAAHSFGGRKTERVKSMYLEGGHAYVYFIYGMYFCLNVVTREAGRPEAVLIRATEPFRPGNKETNGPGKLCRYYGIDRRDDGADLTSNRSRLWIEEAPADAPKVTAAQIEVSARIGIDSAKEARDLPLRFHLKESAFVSKRPSPKKRSSGK